MLTLPRHLPAIVRDAFARVAECQDVFELTARTTEVVLEVCGAVGALGVLAVGDDTPCKVLRLIRDNDAGEEPTRFFEQWFAAEIHSRVQTDLKRRLSSISYSNFSWPYHHIDDAPCKIPADYTVLVPVSSALAFKWEGDESFEGYIAILFDAFPQVNEAFIEIVVSLPQLISELVSGFLRTQAVTHRTGSAFAHDIKHYLILGAELLNKLQAGNFDSHQRIMERLTNVMLKMRLETDSYLLHEQERADRLSVSPLQCSLNELVTAAADDVRILFDAAGVRLDVELADDICETALDPALFPSVIHNLVSNGLKYSTTGGSVRLRTISRPDSVSFEVHNDGIGIRAEDQPHLFSPHFRGSNANGITGNGLGLFVAKTIVEAHGGSIAIASGDPCHTCFVISLPRISAADTALALENTP